MIAPFLFLGSQTPGKQKDESLATEAKRGGVIQHHRVGAIERQNRPRLLGEVWVCFIFFTSIRPSNLAPTGEVHKAEFIQSVDRFGVFKTARVF